MTAFWGSQRAAGALMVVAIIPLALGVFLFLSRNGVQGGAPRSTALFVWERGSILAAVVLTTLGLALFEAVLYETGGRVLARVIVVFVVLAFLGQAAIGGALLQSNLLPAWIGWTTVVWNVALLVVLPIVTPGDIYFPVQHHLMPLLIGISLLWRG